MGSSKKYELGEVVLCYGTYFGEQIGYGYITELGTPYNGYSVYCYKLGKVLRMGQDIGKVNIDEQETFTDY